MLKFTASQFKVASLLLAAFLTLLLQFGTAKNIKNMWPFKKKIWKEIGREYLRTEPESFYSWKVFAVTYQDIISGKTKIKEIYELQ